MRGFGMCIKYFTRKLGHWKAQLWCTTTSSSGQMCVEFTIMLPVLLITALIGFNVVKFVELCVRFDRLAAHAMVREVVSPATSESIQTSMRHVEQRLSQAFVGEGVMVSVTCANQTILDHESSITGVKSAAPSFSVVGTYTSLMATLSWSPWPKRFVLAGVTFEPPPILTHTKRLVIDRHRPGVLL